MFLDARTISSARPPLPPKKKGIPVQERQNNTDDVPPVLPAKTPLDRRHKNNQGDLALTLLADIAANKGSSTSSRGVGHSNSMLYFPRYEAEVPPKLPVKRNKKEFNFNEEVHVFQSPQSANDGTIQRKNVVLRRKRLAENSTFSSTSFDNRITGASNDIILSNIIGIKPEGVQYANPGNAKNDTIPKAKSALAKKKSLLAVSTLLTRKEGTSPMMGNWNTTSTKDKKMNIDDIQEEGTHKQPLRRSQTTDTSSKNKLSYPTRRKRSLDRSISIPSNRSKVSPRSSTLRRSASLKKSINGSLIARDSLILKNAELALKRRATFTQANRIHVNDQKCGKRLIYEFQPNLSNDLEAHNSPDPQHEQLASRRNTQAIGGPLGNTGILKSKEAGHRTSYFQDVGSSDGSWRRRAIIHRGVTSTDPARDTSAKEDFLLTASPNVRKAINSEVEIQCDNGEKRVIRSTCDWNETAINGDHLWCPTSASGDFCYVGEDACCKNGARLKCSACKIIAHTHCIPALVENVKFTCKPTFRDVGPRQYREQTATHHHWVHRRNQKGKCKACNKGFQGKLLFGSKEIVAISCSWCKQAFHNREACFPITKLEETCSLGLHQSIIVPPSWIVKLPRRGSFKSSLRKSPKKRASKKNKTREKAEKDTRTFAIKPIPNANVKPVIVFINPKSGGNQGAKLMQKFQWLLNPRQVFDLTQGGPRAGMEMFRKVSQLRVLACGGDGTVGWVLSILDQMDIEPPPAVAVLPLGTGNDLARALGWGGGYTDEPISKILCNISDGEVIHLDRWKLDVQKNPDAEPSEEGKDTLPLTVVNNYFSFGVDAHITLEFHEAREANPQKFNSRLRNKMFYGQAGTKDLLQRKWKDLCEMCTLECDGKDLTPLLKELRVHAVVFLNIPSYGSGTHPWNRSFGSEQRTDDGKIEVLGLTTYQMPLLQAGGHGTCLAQCTTARIVTKKTIPMQVDGEACRVNPAIIEISHLNKAPMVTKMKAKSSSNTRTLEKVHIRVAQLGMRDYTLHHYDKEKLRLAGNFLFELDMDQDSDLEHVRRAINQKIGEIGCETLSENWGFLDSCTAERFFRIDHSQEHLHYVTDICTDELFLLNPEEENIVVPEPTVTAELPVPVGEVVRADADTSSGLPAVVRTDVSQLLEKHTESLIKAAKLGDLKMVKEIHSAGYSLLSIDPVGQTALHYAARLGHKDIVRYLIASAPPSILDIVDTEKGQTALHQAASNCRRSVCCMLVAAGSSLNIKNHHGQTARELARKAEDQELARYLESQEEFQRMVSDDLETTV